MKKTILFNIALLCVSLFLAAALCEAVLRKISDSRHTSDTIILSNDSVMGYEHRPSITFVNGHNVRVRYNSFGFIGEEPKAVSDGALRIMGVGDSITAAEYLPEDDGYIKRAGDIISRRANRGVEVINAGISGYNTWQELRLIETKSPLIKPDIIVVGICMNDYVGKKPLLRSIGGKVRVDDLRDGSKARYLNYLYQRSELYKLLYDAMHKLKNAATHDGHEKTGFQYIPKDPGPWLDSFKSMAVFCRNNGVIIVFCIFPTKYQVDRGDAHTFKPLSDFFDAENLPYLDLIGPFKDSVGKHLFLERDALHPTKEGHRVAASSLADFMLNKGIVRTGRSRAGAF